ncbi:hypothetical protein [Blastochloris viridis]|uniref:hypothetical protein n=1 Tax=Blastochloris viridis TaxID=1079 RepID=UPI001F38B458|nr:hypothetical protein [Blastochloris viridis]
MNDEDVLSAHVLLNLDEHFHVGEAPDHGFCQGYFEIGADCFSKGPVRITGNEFHYAVARRHNVESPYYTRPRDNVAIPDPNLAENREIETGFQRTDEKASGPAGRKSVSIPERALAGVLITPR